jgi:hypothetical protein
VIIEATTASAAATAVVTAIDALPPARLLIEIH